MSAIFPGKRSKRTAFQAGVRSAKEAPRRAWVEICVMLQWIHPSTLSFVCGSKYNF